MNEFENCNNNYESIKGITLVVLAVIIIIMLILAGVTLNIAFGNNGLISRAKNTTEKWSEFEIKEKDDLSKLSNAMKIEKDEEKEKVDILPPKMFKPTVTATTNSISVNALTTDQEETDESLSSGMGEYSFSKDNGLTWTEYQENGNYTFVGLTPGETYNIKVKAKDNAGNEIITEKISKRTGIQLFPNNVIFGILYNGYNNVKGTTNIGSGTVTSTKTTMSRTNCKGSICAVWFHTIYDLTGYNKIYFTYTQNSYISVTNDPVRMTILGKQTNEHKTVGTYTESLDITSIDHDRTIEIWSTYWNFSVSRVWLE